MRCASLFFIFLWLFVYDLLLGSMGTKGPTSLGVFIFIKLPTTHYQTTLDLMSIDFVLIFLFPLVMPLFLNLLCANNPSCFLFYSFLSTFSLWIMSFKAQLFHLFPSPLKCLMFGPYTWTHGYHGVTTSVMMCHINLDVNTTQCHVKILLIT